MEYTLKINDFEGPLDLLLHLIKEAKMSIFDFSVEQIVKSYLDYIMNNIDTKAKEVK